MLSMETSAMREANKVIQAFYTNPEDRYRYETVERYEADISRENLKTPNAL